MNSTILSGKWKEIKGEVMKTWGELTSDEVDRTNGNVHSLIGLVEQKFGMAKDEAAKRINELFARHQDQAEAKVDTLSDKVNGKIDEAKDALKDQPAKPVQH